MFRIIDILINALKGNKHNKRDVFNKTRISTDGELFELRYIKYGDEFKYFRIPKER